MMGLRREARRLLRAGDFAGLRAGRASFFMRRVYAEFPRRADSSNYSLTPLAAWPRSRKVLGYLPSPHTLNDPNAFGRAVASRPRPRTSKTKAETWSCFEEVVAERQWKTGPLDLWH